jgi:hypothetical protein
MAVSHVSVRCHGEVPKRPAREITRLMRRLARAANSTTELELPGVPGGKATCRNADATLARRWCGTSTDHSATDHGKANEAGPYDSGVVLHQTHITLRRRETT